MPLRALLGRSVGLVYSWPLLLELDFLNQFSDVTSEVLLYYFILQKPTCVGFISPILICQFHRFSGLSTARLERVRARHAAVVPRPLCFYLYVCVMHVWGIFSQAA